MSQQHPVTLQARPTVASLGNRRRRAPPPPPPPPRRRRRDQPPRPARGRGGRGLCDASKDEAFKPLGTIFNLKLSVETCDVTS